MHPEDFDSSLINWVFERKWMIFKHKYVLPKVLNIVSEQKLLSNDILKDLKVEILGYTIHAVFKNS